MCRLNFWTVICAAGAITLSVDCSTDEGCNDMSPNEQNSNGALIAKHAT